jgi:hypothetical protein
VIILKKMNIDEIREYLLERPRTGKLATLKKDGSPHVSPIWFDLDDDGNIVFITRAGYLKNENIRRDPRVALCVDDEQPPFSYVIVEGRVIIPENQDPFQYWSTRISGRYMDDDNYAKRYSAETGYSLVVLKPTKILGYTNITD